MRVRSHFFAGLVTFLVSAGPLMATGEVWRYPEPDPPATGPSEITLSKTGSKKGQPPPTLEVNVKNEDGKPVAGLAVAVTTLSGKKSSATQKGATDANGTLRIRGGEGVEVSRVTLSFAWDAGAKVIRAKVEPKGKDKWEIVEAPYRAIDDGKDTGSCKNLFSLKSVPATKTLVLDFRQPVTLLGCEDIKYGSNKKVVEVGKVAGIGARNVNLGDKNSFSPSDEVKMGLEASTQFDQQFEQISDPVIVGYVKGLMEKVVAASDAPKMPINLRVVHTDDVNAFVTAGGHVYVFTGLLKAAQNESQVAGVLAHEGSHAIARHVTEGATRSSKAQTGAQVGAAALGALLGLKEETTALAAQGASAGAQVITLSFDRKAESEADLLGEQYLWKAGWDPEGIARFFELLQKGSSGKSGPAWLSTHPTHEKRVENGILWARAYLPPKEKYLVDTAEFQEVKRRVAALPAPKKRPTTEGQKSLQQLMSETPTWKGVVAGAPPQQ